MSAARATRRPPVLIFGAHIAALGVLRRLVARGVRCYVVDETEDIIVRSRWYRPAERLLPETNDSAVLAEYLESLALDRAVLVPCSDNWMLAASGLPDRLRDRFLGSFPSRDVVEQFVDKERFGALVDRLEIPRPRTVPLAGPEDLDRLTDDELSRAFLKPTDPQLHRRHFRTKGTFVHSRAEAERVLREGAAAGVSFVYQEWIDGDMRSTTLLEGFVDRHGQIPGMVLRRRIRVAPPMIGNTVSSYTAPLDEAEQAVTDLRRMLADVGFRGAFNVEFKHDVRDGLYKIIELNPRPAWYISTIAAAGLDLPWAIYRDAQGLDVEPAPPYPLGRVQLYEFRDAVAIAGFLRRFRRPPGPVLGPWLRGDRTVFWWRDPMPAFHGAALFFSRRFGRRKPAARAPEAREKRETRSADPAT